MIIEKIDDWGGNVIPGEPVDGDLVRITYDKGTVQEKIYRAYVPPAEPTRVYVHVGATGGDGQNPIGIKNNGSDVLNIIFTLRETSDPSSDIQNVNINWKFLLRSIDGQIFDFLKVHFVNGIATVPYTTTNIATKVILNGSDVNEVFGSAIITLVGEPMFHVYKDFT